MFYDDTYPIEEIETVSITRTILQAFVLPAALCAAGALFFLTLPANAQSLNCDLADKTAEFQICNTEDLIVLDEQLEKAYVKEFISQPTLPQQQVVTKAHGQWLSKRNACLDDTSCLIDRYNERLAELNADVKTAPSLSAFSPE